MKRRFHRSALWVPLLSIALLLGASICIFAVFRGDIAQEDHGSRIGGPFQLIDPSNRLVTDKAFRGRYMLVYFGYTACPDVCPTTLSSVVQALRQLGAPASSVQPIFITVDPGHDTPSVMGAYVANFSPNLIGLTGTPAEVAAAEKAYHVTVETTANGINHSAVLYLMAPDGRFIAPLPADSGATAIAADLKRDLT
jgi:protein SCO1/2